MELSKARISIGISVEMNEEDTFQRLKRITFEEMFGRFLTYLKTTQNDEPTDIFYDTGWTLPQLMKEYRRRNAEKGS